MLTRTQFPVYMCARCLLDMSSVKLVHVHAATGRVVIWLVAPRVGGLALFLLCIADGTAVEDTVLSIVLEGIVLVIELSWT